MKGIKSIVTLCIGVLLFTVYGKAESNVLVGDWEVDRVEAEKRIGEYTQDEDIAFLLHMVLDSMEEIKFSKDGSCNMISDKHKIKREKCWIGNENPYVFYGYSGNEAGEIEVLNDNRVQIGLSDESFPEVLLLEFNRIDTISSN